MEDREKLPLPAPSLPDELPKDPSVVDWDGPDDPANPLNWPSPKINLHIAIVSLFILNANLAATMFAPGAAKLAKEFHITDPTVEVMTVSLYVLGFALGPIFLAPLSELYGRLPIYYFCNSVYFAFTLGCAFSTGVAMFLVFRFIAGCAASGPMSIGGGTIADITPLEKRGKAMALFTMGPLLGPVLGPAIGGFVSQYTGWRWTLRIILIFSGVIGVTTFVFMRETNTAVLLQRKAEHMRKETGNLELVPRGSIVRETPRQMLLNAIIRPLKMLIFLPIVLLVSLYTGLMFGIVFLLFTTFPSVFHGVYGWDEGVSGLAYLGLGIGMMLGLVLFSILSDKLLGQKQKPGSSNSDAKPEQRLILMKWFGPITPLGCFIYGWSAYYHTHWIVPILGTGIIGLGSLFIVIPGQIYLVDCFGAQAAASALAANLLVRSPFGAFLVLAAPPDQLRHIEYICIIEHQSEFRFTGFNMTLTQSHPDDAPPPYTPTDPLTPASTLNDSSSQISADHIAENILSYTHAVEAPNFISAAPFFSERGLPATNQSDTRPFEHTLVLYKRSQAKDYSRYPRCWRSKSEEITQHDWDTFLNYLLPSHLGPASSHPQLPQKLRAEIERDRKDRPQETEEERQARISAVIQEWNISFFRPRGVMIVYCFSREDGMQPESPLCPTCYPNTTSSRTHSNTSRPLFEEPTSSRAVHEPSRASSSTPVSSQNRQASNSAPPGGNGGNGGSSENQYQYSSASTGGPGVWMFNPSAAVNNIASMISDQVQRYSQYIGEQAAEHSRRVSEQAQAVSREAQNNAQAHATYVQQQAAYVQQQAALARERAYNNITTYRNQAQSAWAGPHGPFPGPGRGGFQRGGCGPGDLGRGHPHTAGGFGFGGFGAGRGAWGSGPGMCPPNTTGLGCTQEKSEAGQRDREWGHVETRAQPTGRARSASISSSSSSSSSSFSDSLDSASSDSDLKKGELAALKTSLHNLKEQQAQRRISKVDYRARKRELKRDCKALRSARREFRSAGRRCRGPPAGASSSGPKTTREELGADLEEIKRDIQEIKQHYHNLIFGYRQEKRELKQEQKNHKQEEKQARKEAKAARKEERKEERRRAKEKGKGKAKETEPVEPLANNLGAMEIGTAESSRSPPQYSDTPQPAETTLKDVKQ
ncbi:putative transporter [Arthroderma uncinatum]|uniref:putative transporter n=1 Tax=Arthroderma uncinatum TaxID=74035 RepID=UPI00144A7EED|nr:putative transporter [Arthroderma uncinatum]KAF3480260.1 putative transporter [Arthroderma uncinatum]